MRKPFLSLYFITVLSFMCCSAFAQFSGAFAPAHWTFNGILGGDGSIDTSGAPASIVLNGSDSGNGFPGDDAYLITIPESGTIGFSYVFDNQDMWLNDDFFYKINFSWTHVSNGGAGSISSVHVNAGDVFRFVVINDDDNGRGIATISNFSFISDPSIWNGTANWSDNLNWTNGTPDASDSVVVQSGELTVNVDTDIDDLTLENGTSLIVPSGHTLTVKGDLINNGGTFNVQTGGSIIFERELKKALVTRMRTFGKVKVMSGSLHLIN